MWGSLRLIMISILYQKLSKFIAISFTVAHLHIPLVKILHLGLIVSCIKDHRHHHLVMVVPRLLLVQPRAVS